MESKVKSLIAKTRTSRLDEQTAEQTNKGEANCGERE